MFKFFKNLFRDKYLDREFMWGQTPEYRENFVKKIARLTEESTIQLTKYEIEYQMGCVYNYPNTVMGRMGMGTRNTAFREFEDNLERYNRKLIWNPETGVYTVEKNK